MSGDRRRTEGRVRLAKTQVRLVVGGALLLGAAALFILALPLIPYRPLMAVSYEVPEDEFCPGALAVPVVSRKWQPGVLESGEITSITVQQVRVAEGVEGFAQGQRFEGAEYQIPPDSLRASGGDSGKRPSTPISAPLEDGEWRFGLHITIRGTFLGIPRPQVIDIESEETTTVLRGGLKECEDVVSTFEGGF